MLHHNGPGIGVFVTGDRPGPAFLSLLYGPGTFSKRSCRQDSKCSNLKSRTITSVKIRSPPEDQHHSRFLMQNVLPYLSCQPALPTLASRQTVTAIKIQACPETRGQPRTLSMKINLLPSVKRPVASHKNFHPSSLVIDNKMKPSFFRQSGPHP